MLGAGRVGSTIARDLAADPGFTVTAVDRDGAALSRLGPDLRMVRGDLSDPAAVRSIARGADIVVSAVPGAMGFATLRAVIEAGRNVVDISFFPEDPFLLDALAREREVTALVDCGIAPGLSHALAGHLFDRFDRMERFACYVGGLPAEGRGPFGYRAVFSPADVLQEYTRPARLRVGGREVARPALSEVETLKIPGVGTLEAFLTDGLRTLLSTLDVPDMAEKTLRYPGHAAAMTALREAGFFDPGPVEIVGAFVHPIDLSAKLLERAWTMEDGDEDLTVLRVIAEGPEEGRAVRRTFDLLDRYDRETHTTSMARTTGYTASVIARLLATGHVEEHGIVPPEALGRRSGAFRALLAGLAKRGICLKENVEPMGEKTP